MIDWDLQKALTNQDRKPKRLERFALENDTNVIAVVLRACREFLARDKMFREKYKPNIAQAGHAFQLELSLMTTFLIYYCLGIMHPS